MLKSAAKYINPLCNLAKEAKLKGNHPLTPLLLHRQHHHPVLRQSLNQLIRKPPGDIIEIHPA